MAKMTTRPMTGKRLAYSASFLHRKAVSGIPNVSIHSSAVDGRKV
jgi:hypothetical protein